jgi:aminoglycoside 3-N-acetyltransferase I
MNHMSTAAVRQLAADDIDLMRGLLRMFGEAFEDPETYAARQPSDAYLKSLLAGDTVIALAALDDGGGVGGLAAYELR